MLLQVWYEAHHFVIAVEHCLQVEQQRLLSSDPLSRSSLLDTCQAYALFNGDGTQTHGSIAELVQRKRALQVVGELGCLVWRWLLCRC